MNKLICLFIVVVAVSGCVTSQSSAPVMPKFASVAGKECARECQSVYAECNQGCSSMVGGTYAAMQRAKCLDNCNQILGDCYSTCE